MQAKKYLSAALALGFAAVGVSGNYLPDITHILNDPSGTIYDGTSDSYAPEAVVNRMSELTCIALPSDNGAEKVMILSQNNGYILRQGTEMIESYTFAEADGELITATVTDGTLTFTNSAGIPVTEFYIGDEHIIYDTNGDIHTPDGILRRNTEAPEEQSVEQLVTLINDDITCFKALDGYISGEGLDEHTYGTPDELVAQINTNYLDIDKYSGYVSSYSNDDIKEKLTAVITQLEDMTAAVNTQTPAPGSGIELNMNKLIILNSVLANSLEEKGISVSDTDEGGNDGEPAVTTASSKTTTTKKSTTTKKKTTTTTKKTTKKKTTTTTAAQTQPPATQQQPQQTQAPATTTKQRSVATVATTTVPKFTVKEYSKKVYALKAGVAYDQPDLTSHQRATFTQYYAATCTGETSNGYYRLLIDNYTVYAPMADFSDDPNSTVITSATQKIKTGNINKYTTDMLKLINALRKEYGVSALKGYESLDKAAELRAVELKTLFSHDRPDGTGYKTIFAQQGLNYHRIGENITKGKNSTYTVAEAFDNWKNSQGHLDNMLNPDFEYVAIGYASYTDEKGNDVNCWEMLLYTP